MNRRHMLTLTSAFAATTAIARATPLPRAKIRLGNEVFLRDAWRGLHGRSVGVITNQTGVTSQMVSIVDAIRAHGSIALKAIYAPEHGFRGDSPAGAYVGSYTDPATRLPVYSLYGPTRHASASMLEGLDVLLFDIQDVGDRAYTFISTMAYAMQSAKEHGKEIWILDRPNPVGNTVEGPVLEPAYKSFIGLYPIAMRHGLTIGELAHLFNDHFGIGAALRVIQMEGYEGSMIWPDTGLQWVPTSPNVPGWQTCFTLLCTGLVDNAGINNGVGYMKPFFYAGAYGLDAASFARHLNARNLPGVYFRPATWSPIAGFWHGKDLTGVELIVFDPRRFLAVRTAVEIIVAARTIAPRILDIRGAALDRDWGTATLREGIRSGASADEIIESWSAGLTAFDTVRAKYVLY